MGDTSFDRFCTHCGALLYCEHEHCFRCSTKSAIAVQVCELLDSDDTRTFVLNSTMRAGKESLNPKLVYDGIEEVTRMMKIAIDEWLESGKLK